MQPNLQATLSLNLDDGDDPAFPSPPPSLLELVVDSGRDCSDRGTICFVACLEATGQGRVNRVRTKLDPFSQTDDITKQFCVFD